MKLLVTLSEAKPLIPLSVVSTIASWQNQLDWSLRIGASIVAILAGAPAAWRFLTGMWNRLHGRMNAMR